MRFGGPVLGCVLVLLLATGVAAAEQSELECSSPAQQAQSVVTRNDLDTLIGWIALKTDYDLSSVYHDPPEIVFCEVGDVVDYETDGLLVDELLAAAYDLSRRRINLVRPWAADDPYDLSVLLHEVIHAVQLDNRKWPCLGAPEWEAYALQSLWLAEHGIVPDFDWDFIYMISLCPTDADD
ncbi:DUF6647 family protein [Boseongicola aestuarii]|uniref:DUF6647 domain-containing protein n=1 Tax=Boseongicola aestuarii TaxID=1470561 RepID=A0A238IWZ5_9RHOB|nr:DUF6647 family protein [Boseongicola aestuarii]SMX22988.1 hypothetical protein BOA8489_01088 [Boseongicola aestuarii]